MLSLSFPRKRESSAFVPGRHCDEPFGGAQDELRASAISLLVTLSLSKGELVEGRHSREGGAPRLFANPGTRHCLEIGHLKNDVKIAVRANMTEKEMKAR